MQKFNRVYELKVDVVDLQRATPLANVQRMVTIRLPLAIEFTISRQNQSSSQTGSFRIMNLPEDTRDKIRKDMFQTSRFRAIQFRAGYSNSSGTFMPIVFNGTVNTAYSYRDGTDWITEIDAFDGGQQIATSTVALSLDAGQTSANTLITLSALMPGLPGTAIIGSFKTATKRGEVLLGNTWDFIQQKSNGLAIIDNGQVKALQYDEVIQAGLPVINDDTGLIGLPKLTPTMMELKMVFEPNLTLSQIVSVQSSSQPKINKNWKIMGLTHTGKISPTGAAGECTTDVQMWYRQGDFNVVNANVVI